MTEASNLPIATKWILDAAGEVNRTAISSVYFIYCPHTNLKGTGTLLSSGAMVTCEHVINYLNSL